MTEATSKYRVGVIGGGRMGTHHARAYALHPKTDIVAVADTDAENRELFSTRFDVPGYDDYNEMLDKEDIDISVAILPVRAHADAVVASAEAGVKGVACEKPMTGMLADADRMVEAAESRGVVFAAGVIPRNYPEYQKAADLLAGGEIGDVQSINIYDKNGEGGCHSINLARLFAGNADVDWIVGWAEGDPSSDYEGDEHSRRDGDIGFQGLGGYVRFVNGIECFSHVRQGVRSRVGELGRGIEVIGTKGILFNDTAGLHLMKASESGALEEVQGVFGDTRKGERQYDEEGWSVPTPGMTATVRAIVEAVDTGESPRFSTGDDLRKALEICIAMRESHRQEHSPLKLPLEDRSLVMYPIYQRWNFKKEVFGRDEYMAQMAVQHPASVQLRSS